MKAYLQSFLIALENGAIVQVSVFGEDPQHGRGLAHNEAQEIFPGVQIWDDCTIPVTEQITAEGEKVSVIIGENTTPHKES